MDNQVKMRLRKDNNRNFFTITALCPDDEDIKEEDFQRIIFKDNENNIDELLKFMELENYFKNIRGINLDDVKKGRISIEQRNKIIFILYVNGTTQQQIADTLNISQSYISRIIKKVRREINNKIA
jgi:DNA-directed RNA polymerase specialized sigma subunit